MAVPIFLWQKHSDTQCPPSRNNTHLVDWIMFRHQTANNRMPGFMVSGIALLLFGHDHRLALCAHHDLVFGQFKVDHTHGTHIAACSKQCRFVDQIRQVSTREAWCAARNFRRLHIFRQRHLAHMHFENMLTTTDIRETHHHLPVKAAGPQQSWVENIRAVSGGDNDHSVVHLKTIHLYQ